MPGPELWTFAQALEEAQRDTGKAHLLLGNGFSIACRPDRFTYGALLDAATFEAAHGDVRAVFDLLGTTDFERVIEQLRLSAILVEAYAADPELAQRLTADAEIVREALATTIAARHPDIPFDISDAEYGAARAFLSNFERIYTVNYDMLLYWTVMHEGDEEVPTNDGFTDSDDRDAEYVVWEPYREFRRQRLFFLHGGLHLYDHGFEISKITWSRTGIPLIDQIREALAQGRYPLIVTEGTSADKEAKILHNAYLSHGLRSFAQIKGSLFIHGHSLAENDDHILRRVERGALKRLYVSLHGGPDTARNRATVQRAEHMSTTRPRQRPLTVRFYDAASARPWGGPE